MDRRAVYEFLVICLLVLAGFLLAALISACSVKPVEVYIPQKCQTEIPSKVDCSSVEPQHYDEVVQCMVDNKLRTELLETRLKFCIGE